MSLPDKDVEFLDQYAKRVMIPSRSAVIQRALRLLRATELGPSYEKAWQEWDADAEAWDSAASDGIERNG